MKVINFSQNWNNKLDCAFFTTIRPANSYYNLGDQYNIYLNKQFVKTVCIIDIKNFYLKDITTFVTYLDAGKSVSEFNVLMAKFYGSNPAKLNGQFFFILLKSV